MHYFKRNIGDYHKKAGKLTMLEHGAYTLLIDACYDRERFPTLEESYLWTWATTEDEKKAVQWVLSRFFTLRDGVYEQKRIAEELSKYQESRIRNAEIAKQREEKRRLARLKQHETYTLEHDSCTNRHLTTNHKPITNITTLAPSDSRSPQKVSWSIDGFKIEPEVLKTFELAYPAVNLNTEIAKAHAWVVANPKNRKSNWSRFLNNWLQKAQDRAPVVKSTDWRDDPRFRGIV